MRMRRTGPIVAVTLVLSIGVAIWGCSSVYESTEQTIVAEVLDKDRVCKGNGNGGSTCEYLVFTEFETFKVADSWMLGRFDSSNVYGRIREGETYEFRVRGWRMPFFSQYQNIVEATPVKR